MATVLGPSPSAKLPTVVKQPLPLPVMPLIAMHVALAVGTPPSDAAANPDTNPDRNPH